MRGIFRLSGIVTSTTLQNDSMRVCPSGLRGSTQGFTSFPMGFRIAHAAQVRTLLHANFSPPRLFPNVVPFILIWIPTPAILFPFLPARPAEVHVQGDTDAAGAAAMCVAGATLPRTGNPVSDCGRNAPLSHVFCHRVQLLHVLQLHGREGSSQSVKKR